MCAAWCCDLFGDCHGQNRIIYTRGRTYQRHFPVADLHADRRWENRCPKNRQEDRGPDGVRQAVYRLPAADRDQQKRRRRHPTSRLNKTRPIASGRGVKFLFVKTSYSLTFPGLQSAPHWRLLCKTISSGKFPTNPSSAASFFRRHGHGCDKKPPH